MGNSIKNKKDSDRLESLKNCQEYSKLCTEIKEYLMKNKTLTLTLDFLDDDVYSLYQKQLEYFLYFAVSFCETIRSRSVNEVMDKRDASQIDYLVNNLQKVLNYMGRVCADKAFALLWRTYDQGVLTVAGEIFFSRF